MFRYESKSAPGIWYAIHIFIRILQIMNYKDKIST
jgi:hypothetical protein